MRTSLRSVLAPTGLKPQWDTRNQDSFLSRFHLSISSLLVQRYSIISRNEEVRTNYGADDVIPIWLYGKRPFAPLSSQRISNRVKRILRSIGIYAKTGSIRSAAASKLLNKGLNPHTVMKLGAWKSQEVFMKHYDRSIACIEASEMLFE